MRRPRHLGLALILALVLALVQPPGVDAVSADAPRIRPLETSPPDAPVAPEQAPARPLPATVAVCRDPGTPRCWAASRPEECGGPERVFRVVIGTATDAGAVTALAQCRAEFPN